MIIKIITFLIIGILIGMGIQDKINEKVRELQDNINYNYEELIKEKDKHVRLYKEYVELLENEYIGEYKKALNDTLNQNIELRKKLKALE